MERKVLATVWAAVSFASAAWATPASAPPARGLPVDEAVVTNGTVTAMTQVAHRIFLGGDFSYVGTVTGPGFAFDPTTGSRDVRFPRLEGKVGAVIGDGAGGFFVGGDLRDARGTGPSQLVHLLPDGTADPEFRPRFKLPVGALALANSRLYVAGTASFHEGEAHTAVAALDARTGMSDPGFLVRVEVPRLLIHSIPPPILPSDAAPCEQGGVDIRTPAGVLSLAVAGSRLYLGGVFSRVNDISRENLAAVDATTGAVIAGFDPAMNNPSAHPRVSRPAAVEGTVRSLSVVQDRLLVGGAFDAIGGRRASSLAAVQLDTGEVDTRFAASVEGFVEAILAEDDRIYVGGEFVLPHGDERGLIAIDPLTGSTIGGFRPPPLLGVQALAHTGGRLFVGAVRRYRRPDSDPVVALDPGTGRLRDRGPRGVGDVNALASSGERVYAGGSLISVGGVARPGLAAIDARTGMLDTRFRPPGRALRVRGLAASSQRVYIAQSLDLLPQRHRNLIAFDAVTGVPDMRFRALGRAIAAPIAKLGQRVYANDYARGRVVAVDGRTGRRDSAFRAPMLGAVSVLAAGPRRVYVGTALPSDTSASSPRSERPGLISLDARTGEVDGRFRAPVTLFGGDEKQGVSALLLRGARLYASGAFGRVTYERPGHTIALDARTGTADLGFHAPPVPASALAASRGTLYAAEDPQSGYQGLLTLDDRTGRGRPKDETNLDGGACALVATRSRLYVGGDFRSVGGLRRSSFAVLSARR